MLCVHEVPLQVVWQLHVEEVPLEGAPEGVLCQLHGRVCLLLRFLPQTELFKCRQQMEQLDCCSLAMTSTLVQREVSFDVLELIPLYPCLLSYPPCFIVKVSRFQRHL